MSNHSGGLLMSLDGKIRQSRWGAVAAMIFDAGSDSNELLRGFVFCLACHPGVLRMGNGDAV